MLNYSQSDPSVLVVLLPIENLIESRVLKRPEQEMFLSSLAYEINIDFYNIFIKFRSSTI